VTGSTDFPLNTDKDERRVDWKSLLKAYSNYKSFTADPVTSVLDKVDKDAELATTRDVRNILTHRAAPPRQFGIATGPSQVTPTSRITRVNLTLDKNTTASCRKEIARLLLLGLSGIRTFVDTKF
jgi:hypothetical protein